MAGSDAAQPDDLIVLYKACEPLLKRSSKWNNFQRLDELWTWVLSLNCKPVLKWNLQGLLKLFVWLGS